MKLGSRSIFCDRFKPKIEVAGWGGCGGCDDGWASLMNVQAVDVCGNDGGDAGLCVPCNLGF